MRGTLYLVGTPIGNMSDITLRALEVLKSVDAIACEDTRHTLALLNSFGIKKPLVSYYRQKEREGTEQIKGMLDAGKNVALVTDAGMPCISDPGSVLVKALYEEDYKFEAVPGPTAVTSAAALIGTENGFTFAGFLPEKKARRDWLIDKVKSLPHTVIFYAAPHDVNRVLAYLLEKMGDREAAVIKEITKIHETVIKGTLSTLAIDDPRGEFVIAVEPEAEEKAEPSEEEISAALKASLNNGSDKKEAIKEVSKKYGISKNTVYKISLNL